MSLHIVERTDGLWLHVVIVRAAVKLGQHGPIVDAALRDAVAAGDEGLALETIGDAIEAEREACARLADAHATDRASAHLGLREQSHKAESTGERHVFAVDSMQAMAQENSAMLIAQRIRARGGT